ncbi:MAG: DUF268 domain-containing protein [Planctomycetes bacterium]|nr:DUF268 domain-containing protein [Planctomycetota bacterium]
MLRSLRRRWRERLEAWGRDRAAWRRFWTSYHAYRRLAPAGWQPEMRYLYPCIGDDTAQTAVEPTYFYQDAWAFEKIVAADPDRHVDVGSHHKFVALLSKVLPVTMVDIRPLSLPLASLQFREGSVLALPFESHSLPSVSSLCVIEHVGLGRYGDPLDPDGSEKALAELKRVVQPGGDLYVSVPLHNGNRAYFNAHRTFTEEYLFELFEPFELLEKRYIYGDEFGAEHRTGFGTGCYHLRRPA